MGCRTRRFVFLALLCVSLIPVQVRPVQAGWGGWQAPLPNGFPTIAGGVQFLGMVGRTGGLLVLQLRRRW